MEVRDSKNISHEIASAKLRRLALVASVVTAIAGSLGLGLYFLIVPSFLALGTLLQPYFHGAGRLLMWIGSILLSLWIFPYGLGTLFSYRLVARVDVLGLALASLVLVVLCDVGLAMDLARRKRTQSV